MARISPVWVGYEIGVLGTAGRGLKAAGHCVGVVYGRPVYSAGDLAVKLKLVAFIPRSKWPRPGLRLQKRQVLGGGVQASAGTSRRP